MVDIFVSLPNFKIEVSHEPAATRSWRAAWFAVQSSRTCPSRAGRSQPPSHGRRRTRRWPERRWSALTPFPASLNTGNLHGDRGTMRNSTYVYFIPSMKKMTLKYSVSCISPLNFMTGRSFFYYFCPFIIFERKSNNPRWPLPPATTHIYTLHIPQVSSLQIFFKIKLYLYNVWAFQTLPQQKPNRSALKQYQQLET